MSKYIDLINRGDYEGINKFKQYVKNVCHKFWDKQVSLNQRPTISQKLLDFFGEKTNSIFVKTFIINYFIEYNGGFKVAQESISKLTDKVFDINDYPQINIGGYDFKFKINIHRLPHEKEPECTINCLILKGGSVILIETGNEVTFEELNNNPEYEDMLWEIESEITDICQEILTIVITEKIGVEVDVINIMLQS
jgi:hypothetical protein